ncbi:MAG: O-antigen ligase family protein [Acidobacteriota bacterium]|nr:MAG: O-antigen ligase family protein [Acidobacteriota bacterium]
MSRSAVSHTPLRSVPAPAQDPRHVVIAAHEIMLMVLVIGCIAVAWAFPFRPVKYATIVTFGLVLLGQTTRRPAIGLALVAFASPALDLSPPGLFPVRGLNAETALIGLLLFIWARTHKMEGPDPLRSLLSRMVLVYVVLILVSSINSWFMWRVGLFDLLAKSKNHLSWLLFLPVAFHALRDKRDQKLVFFACTLSLFLIVAQSVNIYWMPFVSGTLERYRASGMLAQQPNLYGGALALYVPILIAMSTKPIGSRWMRLWLGVAALLAGFNLILTLSRGAWAAAAAGVLAVALVRNVKLLLLVAALGIGYQFWVPEAAIDRVKETADADGDIGTMDQIADDSTQMRVEQYRSLKAMVLPRPILGWGYKSYPKVFERLGTLGRQKGAHSTYCQVATEEGLIGLAVLAALFLIIISTSIKAYRFCEDPFYRWMGIGLLGAALSMLVGMASGARFEAQKIFIYFWIMIGIAEREAILAQMRGGSAAPVLVSPQQPPSVSGRS